MTQRRCATVLRFNGLDQAAGDVQDVRHLAGLDESGIDRITDKTPPE